VWDVSRLWRVVLDRALKPLGVTRSQYSIIAFLSRRDGMTQTALAADLELTKVAVGGLLERMEAVGLVERRADKSDARVRRVYLTRKGTRITQKIRELVDPIEAEMLAPVGDAELDGAIHTLGTIKGTLLDLGEANGNGSGAATAQRRKAAAPD
jgi:DNA-binding MarR family transcriptional regulator